MEKTVTELREYAKKLYPNMASAVAEAYVRGYIDSQNAYKYAVAKDDDFFTKVATGLHCLWPSGEKDGKYAWKESVPNLVKRLKFIWNEQNLGNSYTVEDCLRAGRRYLAQFQNDTKYMQILKYFIFKQTKLVSKIDGKITYSYKSTLADFLEDKTAQIEFSVTEETEPEVMLIGQGELI